MADCSWRTHYWNNFFSVPRQTAPEGHITATTFPVSKGRLLLKNTLLQQFFQCPTADCSWRLHYWNNFFSLPWQTAPEEHITATIFSVSHGRLLLKDTLLQQFFQCPTADCSWRTHYCNNFSSVPWQIAPEGHITATIFPVSHGRLLFKDTTAAIFPESHGTLLQQFFQCPTIVFVGGILFSRCPFISTNTQIDSYVTPCS